MMINRANSMRGKNLIKRLFLLGGLDLTVLSIAFCFVMAISTPIVFRLLAGSPTGTWNPTAAWIFDSDYLHVAAFWLGGFLGIGGALVFRLATPGIGWKRGVLIAIGIAISIAAFVWSAINNVMWQTIGETHPTAYSSRATTIMISMEWVYWLVVCSTGVVIGTRLFHSAVRKYLGSNEGEVSRAKWMILIAVLFAVLAFMRTLYLSRYMTPELPGFEDFKQKLALPTGLFWMIAFVFPAGIVATTVSKIRYQLIVLLPLLMSSALAVSVIYGNLFSQEIASFFLYGSLAYAFLFVATFWMNYHRKAIHANSELGPSGPSPAKDVGSRISLWSIIPMVLCGWIVFFTYTYEPYIVLTENGVTRWKVARAIREFDKSIREKVVLEFEGDLIDVVVSLNENAPADVFDRLTFSGKIRDLKIRKCNPDISLKSLTDLENVELRGVVATNQLAEVCHSQNEIEWLSIADAAIEGAAVPWSPPTVLRVENLAPGEMARLRMARPRMAQSDSKVATLSFGGNQPMTNEDFESVCNLANSHRVYIRYKTLPEIVDAERMKLEQKDLSKLLVQIYVFDDNQMFSRLLNKQKDVDRLPSNVWELARNTNVRFTFSGKNDFASNYFWDFVFFGNQEFDQDIDEFFPDLSNRGLEFSQGGKKQAWLPFVYDDFFRIPASVLDSYSVVSFDYSWLPSFKNARVPWWDTPDEKLLESFFKVKELYFPSDYHPSDMPYLEYLESLRLLQVNPRDLFKTEKSANLLRTPSSLESVTPAEQESQTLDRLVGFEVCQELQKLILLDVPDEAVISRIEKLPELTELVVTLEHFEAESEESWRGRRDVLRSKLRERFPSISVTVIAQDSQERVPAAFHRFVESRRQEFQNVINQRKTDQQRLNDSKNSQSLDK